VHDPGGVGESERLRGSGDDLRRDLDGQERIGPAVRVERSPSTYSIARYGTPSDSPTSNTVTMPG